ncbi:MAG: hypothetical protein LBS84_06040 [Clostridiales bacterium]|jgi:Cd2+/Zn2+-exporting ATPase|nr:hypothetical protein [Clostridiales bacterium]
MEAALKREYILSGLCCPMCAEKMEKRIRKLEGVVDAVIEFTTARLSLSVDSVEKLSAILTESTRIVKQYEPDISFAEVETAISGEKRVY